MGAPGAQAFAEALRGNTTLQALNLGNNEIRTEGAQAVAEALRGNTTLQTLDLQWNDEIGKRTERAIGRTLRGNTALRNLLVVSEFASDFVRLPS